MYFEVVESKEAFFKSEAVEIDSENSRRSALQCFNMG